MWAFASRQVRRWMILAVGVPVAAWALDRLGERLEARTGETLLTQAVRTGGAALHRQERGPFRASQEGPHGTAGRPEDTSRASPRPRGLGRRRSPGAVR